MKVSKFFPRLSFMDKGADEEFTPQEEQRAWFFIYWIIYFSTLFLGIVVCKSLFVDAVKGTFIGILAGGIAGVALMSELMIYHLNIQIGRT